MPCKVCNHPRVAEADALLNAGTSDQKAAIALGGMTRASVRRHRTSGHVKPSPSAPIAPARPPADGSPASRVHAILDNLDAVDVTKLSTSAQVAYFNTRLRAIETLNRIAPSTLPAETEAEAKFKAAMEMVEVHDDVIARLPVSLRAVFAVSMHERFEGRKKGPVPHGTAEAAVRGEAILARLLAEEQAARDAARKARA
jgi:hypothetical protein